MRLAIVSLLVGAAATRTAATQAPLVLQADASASSSSSSAGVSSWMEDSALAAKKLYGRFLHVTDLHPDPFYVPGGAVSVGCHSKKPHKGRRAGYWGTGVSECDSPQHLVTASLDWVAANWLPNKTSSDSESEQASAGKGLDFIIWTGDSARHDLDSGHPRTRSEIYALNRWTVAMLEERFPGTPLVPSIGNNDIFPHNIMFAGPNEITKAYVSIWQDHIPESEIHTFFQGGYFAKTVVPGLSVLSLNTLWFYDSNRAVDGCKKKKSDPGTQHLNWLEAQLDQLRRKGGQAHLIGHVPPTAGNYFRRCYDRYTDIVLRYQDTIVGQSFGHMNIDAVFIQEEPMAAGVREEQDVSIIKPMSLSGDLRDDYSTLPGRGRTDLDLYHFFFAAPSIVPTYWPTVRLWTYNTTRPRHGALQEASSASSEVEQSEYEDDEEEDEDDEDEASTFGERHTSADGEVDISKRKHSRPKHGRRKHRKHKHLPRHASPDSPSRSNRYLSLLGYSQWVLNIDAANEQHEKNKKLGVKKQEKQKLDFYLEYATYEAETLWTEFISEKSDESAHIPVPKSLLERELVRLGVSAPHYVPSLPSTSSDLFDTDDFDDASSDVILPSAHQASASLLMPKRLKHLTEYALPSMTIPEVLNLARRLAVSKGLWRRYKDRLYASSGAKELH